MSKYKETKIVLPIFWLVNILIVPKHDYHNLCKNFSHVKSAHGQCWSTTGHDAMLDDMLTTSYKSLNFFYISFEFEVWYSFAYNIPFVDYASKGVVTCAVCPESAWLVTFLIGNVSTGVVTWSALRCGASGESGKKVAAAPLSNTAAAAAAAKTWFAKHPVDYMLHNRFPWKRSGRRSSMWPPYSLRRNLSAAACRPCDRSLS